MSDAPWRADWNGQELILANELVERRWRAEHGRLRATSFKDLKLNREWLAKPSSLPAPMPATPLPSNTADDWKWTFSTQMGPALPVEADALRVELTAQGTSERNTWRFEIFKEASGIAMQLVASSGAATQTVAAGTDAVTGIELADQQKKRNDFPAEDLLEFIQPTGTHLRLIQVSLYDQTDIRNELVFENEWLLHPNEREIALQGCLFILEETLTGRGLILLKEAPLPGVRPVRNDCDLRLRGGGMCFHGQAAGPYQPGHPHYPMSYQLGLYGHGTGPEGGEGYRFVTLAYAGGRLGRIAALQTYHRCRRTYQPGRDGLFLSNTWGDRNRDGRICESFMEREIEAGARLGVDVIQIDDGWQCGRTSNSVQPGGVWEGFHAADPKYWEAHSERFPGGLEPVIAQAKARGLRFGLWFSPDAAEDYANWERDAARILDLHRTLGVEFFKIDGVKARTKCGEGRLRDFFSRVLRESDGRIVFDLDVTAEVRPGYFGRPEVGPLFVENRYTDYHRYWPHHTLRNLWRLAQYVDPVRLRMEFLNNARHTNLYAGDPLAPHAYAPSYLFASTMIASPLGWFELSSLPDRYFSELPDLVRVWREHRTRLHAGRIYPVGECPDGTSWTGFLSVRGSEGYALLFREHTPRGSERFDLSVFPIVPQRAVVLAGRGQAEIQAGVLQVGTPTPLQFLFVQLNT